MDYRELLKRYIAHVIDCEGVDFIDHPWRDPSATTEQIAELRKLSDEVLSEGPYATQYHPGCPSRK